MKLQIKVTGLDLSAGEEALLRRDVDRLAERLDEFDPDQVELELVVEKQARRQEFTSHARLRIMDRTLPVARNSGSSVRSVIRQVFEDLEEQRERLISEMRSEPTWKRKRGARDAEATESVARELIEERALLSRALEGDRNAFDVVAESRLAGVRKVIYGILSSGGREPTTDSLDQALALTMANAFEHLGEKPEHWSLHGWLAWTARKELESAVHS